jgi:hypothetical protein
VGKLSATDLALRRYVLDVVMPLWIASGSIDYVLHRNAKIESNAGTTESLMHAVGISMSAVPVLAGLFLEVDAGVVLAMIGGYAAHAGMTIWDVSYASTKREVEPLEQHVHGMLELLPFTALSFMLVAHRHQALALVGRGTSHPRLRRVLSCERSPRSDSSSRFRTSKNWYAAIDTSAPRDLKGS